MAIARINDRVLERLVNAAAGAATTRPATISDIQEGRRATGEARTLGESDRDPLATVLLRNLALRYAFEWNAKFTSEQTEDGDYTVYCEYTAEGDRQFPNTDRKETVIAEIKGEFAAEVESALTSVRKAYMESAEQDMGWLTRRQKALEAA